METTIHQVLLQSRHCMRQSQDCRSKVPWLCPRVGISVVSPLCFTRQELARCRNAAILESTLSGSSCGFHGFGFRFWLVSDVQNVRILGNTRNKCQTCRQPEVVCENRLDTGLMLISYVFTFYMLMAFIHALKHLGHRVAPARFFHI